MDERLDRARALLSAARRVAVLTGAGISAESGIPTFRDAMTGLWSQFRPEDLATPEAFAANPKMVWEWYAWRRERVAKVAPNAGHAALVDARAAHAPLHAHHAERRRAARAGRQPQRDRAARQPHGRPVLRGGARPRRRRTSFPERRRGARGAARRCARASSGSAKRCRRRRSTTPLPRRERCDVFLSVGTSTSVEPAASLPFAALEAGAAVIEVNPARTPLSAQRDDRARGRGGRGAAAAGRLGPCDATRGSAGDARARPPARGAHARREPARGAGPTARRTPRSAREAARRSGGSGRRR